MMKEKKLLIMATGPVICAMALFLIGQVGFISIALAAGKTTENRGYAEFWDEGSYAIKSDNGGTYSHRDIDGDDFVTLTIENRSSELFRSDITIGPYGVSNGNPWDSPRRVHFLFDVLDDAIEKPGLEHAMYDILAWKTLDVERRGNCAGAKCYLNDDTVHLQVAISIPGSKPLLKYVAFIVDGITREAIEAWDSELDTSEYKFAKGEDGIEGNGDDHLRYHLGYDGCTVTEVDEGETWTVELYSDADPINLYVYKAQSKKKGGSSVYNSEVLATYANLPFGYTTWYIPSTAAPGKRNTLSALWGRIKAK